MGLHRTTWLVVLCCCASACVDKQARNTQQSLAFLDGWFAKASAGARDDELCHGLGTLKHPQVSCADMLKHAGNIEPFSRTPGPVNARDCFGDVCGEFFEVDFNSVDLAGNEVRESAVLKRDDGVLRLYWYRSDTVLEQLRAANPAPSEEEKDPQQVAYDEVVARYPALYQYPPCYGVHVSSSNLAGELMPKDAMDEDAINEYASSCGDNFCLALVGNKIAPLCPN